MTTHPHEHNPRKFGMKSSSSNYALLHSNVKVWLFSVWDAGKKKVKKKKKKIKMARWNRKIGYTYSRTIREPIYCPMPHSPAQYYIEKNSQIHTDKTIFLLQSKSIK